ncbi:hypothetical protein [Cellulosimicrobium cellulans]|uniref:hypothetical protein n=1 Tax=Cellulosimicrobium cellulans TaxID=1710 RepID=UPI00130D87C7|nr:hypothetical protein [Cellulosimicrobium cellulans]
MTGRSRDRTPLDAGARCALVAVAGATAVVWLQATWVNTRLMQPLGYGSPTWLAAVLGWATAALAVVCVWRRVRRGRSPARPGPGAWVVVLGVWWACCHLQWAVLMSEVSLADPLDHDTTPLELVLLLAALTAVARLVRIRSRPHRS